MEQYKRILLKEFDSKQKVITELINLEAILNLPKGNPVFIERYFVALDGSSSGLTDGDETSVDVSSDVTFTTDSAELSAQADDALKGVAAGPGS